MTASGPLVGIRVLELSGLGPVPFCGMMLADMGADVVRVDRVPTRSIPDSRVESRPPLWDRGRRSIAVDLTARDGAALLLELVERADALIEGFRPGVTERLGVGPTDCWSRNPRLVYGRVTGYGQTGPAAATAGHDLNFIALSGVLAAIGRHGQPPSPPLNLVGDFGGGGMLLAVGVCAALLHAARTGQGQVVDAAMVDGSALLMTSIHGMRAQGQWKLERGTNLLDSGAPFYDVYRAADGRFLAVAALERRFFDRLIEHLGLSGDPDMADRMNRARWPAIRAKFARAFATKASEDWCALLEDVDCCVSPVLDLDEAPAHPHLSARETYVTHGGAVQPAPAPRFSETPSRIQHPPARPGEHTDEVLADWLGSP